MLLIISLASSWFCGTSSATGVKDDQGSAPGAAAGAGFGVAVDCGGLMEPAAESEPTAGRSPEAADVGASGTLTGGTSESTSYAAMVASS